ncbi:M55 family metallopeptidase [Archangium lansingense]|uniref:M55 family metallopeptidase n=1 Tax=Archangium lansingense TaxID=2995310 RepID=A0ABT3ZVU1_9BACT|nr:M55 family metallopeptidase [Archangium lansinium]MCY1073510.1 M55 family metallopeptidase [Archangium lansinium]
MRSRRALLVVDLEGVAGVDSPGALISGTPEYTRAQALLTAEVNAAVEGLLAAGFQRVRVSDSHLCGSGESNLLPEALHPAAEPCFLPDDAYAPHLFEEVDAVACLGMHAAAGSAGFGAHTVDLLGAWTCAGRALSEADLVLALAAEAGVPAVFVSGDDVLQAQLGGRVGYVRTKVALSVTRAFSREPEAVLPELTRAAAQPARSVEPLPDAPLVLTFKSGHQAALASGAGARRLDHYRVEVEGRTFRERYTRALGAASAASSVLAEAVADVPGSSAFTRDATALFRLRGPPAPPPSPRTEAVDRALGAFLSLTEGQDDESRALRALTLHMLEGHAPGAFARRGLGPTLESAVAALAEVPLALPDGLSPDVGMARVDAWYVRRERGLSHAPLEPYLLRSYLEHLDGEGHGLHAWLLGEMAASRGLDVRLSIPARAMREASRVADLYWLTHLYLLDTRYLRAAPSHPDAVVWTEELLVATPWVVEQANVDLAAELAFCLQCVGEAGGGAHEALLSLLVEHQQPDGCMEDAHATAGALIAFAGSEERSSFPR